MSQVGGEEEDCVNMADLKSRYDYEYALALDEIPSPFCEEVKGVPRQLVWSWALP